MPESQPTVGVELSEDQTKKYEAVVLFGENDWLDDTPFDSDQHAVGISGDGQTDIINRKEIKSISNVLYPSKFNTGGSFVYTRMPDVDDIDDMTRPKKYAELARSALGYGSVDS